MTLKSFVPLAAGLCVLLVIPTAASAQEGSGTATSSSHMSVDFFGAQKQLDSDDWKPIENQFEGGVLGTVTPANWPVGIAADLLYSSGSDTISGIHVSGNTIELGAGARKIFDIQQLHPYLGGGVEFARAEARASNGVASNSDDGTGFGVWGGAGAFVRVAGGLELGVGIRYSSANVETSNTSVNAGGLAFGLSLGYGN